MQMVYKFYFDHTTNELLAVLYRRSQRARQPATCAAGAARRALRARRHRRRRHQRRPAAGREHPARSQSSIRKRRRLTL